MVSMSVTSTLSVISRGEQARRQPGRLQGVDDLADQALVLQRQRLSLDVDQVAGEERHLAEHGRAGRRG
jgi:hypothetical protein